MADEIVLDHLAVASECAFDQFVRYYGDLGGMVRAGGLDPGFWFWQVIYPSGMTIEMLQDDPDHPEDFLRRFLDRRGPGPHHLTFKVPDLVATLERVEQGGYTPVGVDLDNPSWQQAFLHPKEGPGVVIQLASTGADPDEPAADLGDDPRPGATEPPIPHPRTAEPADLEHVVLLVADLDREVALFTTLLGGRETARSVSDLGPAVDLVWPNQTVLRLVAPTSAAAVEWMGREHGRIHHVAFRVNSIAGLGPVSEIGEDRYELAPEHNLGLRLRFTISPSTNPATGSD